MFFTVIQLFVSVCRAVEPRQPLCRFSVRLPFVGTHRMRPLVALADTRGVSLQDYLTTNFRVSSAKVMKYMPWGNPDTSICWLSAVMLPERTV